MTMNHSKYRFLLLTLLFLPVLTAVAAKTSTIQVNITGLNNHQGVVRLAMFNNPQTFSDKNDRAPGAFQKGIASINERNQAVYIFKNVPYGTYAIKLFHDEDNSGKLTRNFFGKPTEGFGFSNNPPIMNRAPTFDQAKFMVNQPRVNMSIQIVNP